MSHSGDPTVRRAFQELAAEPSLAADPQALLERAVFLAVLACRPDEEVADDDDRHDEQNDGEHLGDEPHGSANRFLLSHA